MAAYFVAEVDWHDEAARAEYTRLLTPSVERFGGQFLLRTREPVVMEGEWHGDAVVLRFDSVERATEWFASDDYKAALEVRLRAATSNIVLVDA